MLVQSILMADRWFERTIAGAVRLCVHWRATPQQPESAKKLRRGDLPPEPGFLSPLESTTQHQRPLGLMVRV